MAKTKRQKGRERVAHECGKHAMKERRAYLREAGWHPSKVRPGMWRHPRSRFPWPEGDAVRWQREIDAARYE